MKKINYLISILLCLNLLNGCAGYKPIFGSSNLQFKISEYVINGDEEIGNNLYLKLNNLSKTQKEFSDFTPISLNINSIKNKEKMSADSAGKTKEYKISITTSIEVKNYTNNNIILNQTFNSSILYRVQEQYSDTVKAENRSTEELILKIYKEILINLSEKISQQ